MKMRIVFGLTLLAVSAALSAADKPGADSKGASVAPVLTGPEASIPFATQGGIYDFHVEDELGLWVQARSGQWYYGKFLTPCLGIQFAITLGFVPGGGVGTFDRLSSVVSHQSGKCSLTSLRTAEPPPGVKPKKAPAP